MLGQRKLKDNKQLGKFSRTHAGSLQAVWTRTPRSPLDRDLQGYNSRERNLDIVEMLVIIQFEISHDQYIKVWDMQNNNPVTSFV